MPNAQGLLKAEPPRVRTPTRHPERVHGARTGAELAQSVAHRRGRRPRARRGRRRAARTPCARWAASAEACVQPEPCAAPPGWRSPGISVSVSPSKKVSVAVVAVAAGDHDVPRAERVHGLRELGRGLDASSPVSAAASGMFGVATVARGRICSISAARASGASSTAPGLGDHHRVDDERRGGVELGQRLGDGPDRRLVAEHADLDRVDADVARDGADLGEDHLRARRPRPRRRRRSTARSAR